jgi:hypothetical protein
MGKNGYAEIYIIISPSGRQYVGKANCFDSKGRSHGTLGRWKGHLRDARSKDGGRCRLLNTEIRSYNHDDFIVQPLLTCLINDTPIYERQMIQSFDTLYRKDNQMGLNINEGGNSGNLSEETKQRMSESRKAFANKHPDRCKLNDETKRKISQTLIDNVTRYDHDGSELPKYVKYINWNDRRGYQVVSHPCFKNKYFVSTTKPLDYLLDQANSYIQDTAFIETP